MMRALTLRLLVVTTMLTFSPSASASLIKWGYDWNSTAFVTAGTGKVKFTPETFNVAYNDSHVVAASLQVDSTASALTPDTFTTSGGMYMLTINLKDYDSGLQGSLSFTGQLQGSFSQYSALVTNKFGSPQTKDILLGFTTFIVTIDSYTPPGPANQGNLGSIGAMVEVSSLKPAEKTPEPSALALAGLGAGFTGLRWWRRRKAVH